jgi:large subunit ribosomal protein L21
LKEKEDQTMFALIRVAGKQYRVQNGTELLVNRLALDEGAAFDGAEVLMLGDGDDVQVGAPLVEGAKVAATVVRHSKGRKIRVFKYKAKKNYRRRMGAREHQTLLRINSITGTDEKTPEPGTGNRRMDAAPPVLAATFAPAAPEVSASVAPTTPVIPATPVAPAAPAAQTPTAQMPVAPTAPAVQASPPVTPTPALAAQQAASVAEPSVAPAPATPATTAPVTTVSSQTEGASTTNGT